MAVLSDITFGTINLAAGSTAVTGTGTLFQTAQLKEGDTLQIQNLTAVIASVNSNTSLTLTEPWTGVALTNAPYRARFMPDGSRQTSRATTMIELVGNGVLSNLAELGVEDGKVPVGNAAGEYELADLVTDPNGTLAKFAALTPEANKVFITNGASDPILATIAAILGYTPANKAGDIFGGNVDIAPTGGNGQVRVSIDGTNYNWLNHAQVAIRNNSTGAYSYLNGSGAWLLRNGDINLDSGGLKAKGGTVDAIYNGVGLKMRWGQNESAISWLSVDANGAGQMALYGPAAISYFSGDGDNLLRGTFYRISRGNLSVSGSLSKGSGTFLIDHPLDPTNKNLRHGFVESTEYVNIYRGMVDLVDGRMTVDIDAAFGMMDGTFAALNADVMVSSLQNQYGPDRVWVEAPADSGKFTIVCEDAQSAATVAWMVTGRRNDAFVRSDLDQNTDNEGRFIPEFDKEDA